MENHSTEELRGTSNSAPSSASSSASSSFDILFEYEGSKQPLSVNREDVVMKIENQLAKLGMSVVYIIYSK